MKKGAERAADTPLPFPYPSTPTLARLDETGLWRSLGIVLRRDPGRASVPAAPSGKKPERPGILAAAGPGTLARQGQKHPCPGRLPSEGKTRHYNVATRNKLRHDPVL